MITNEQLNELREHDGCGVLMKTIGFNSLTLCRLYVSPERRVYAFQNSRSGSTPNNFDEVSFGFKYSYILSTDNVEYYEILPIIF